MKKIFVVLMSVILAVATACSGGGNGDAPSSSAPSELSYTPVNVNDYAVQGQLYPLEIKLGDSAGSVESYYSSAAGSDEDMSGLAVNETEKYTELNAGEEMYYYLSGSETISAIVSYKNPYDFPLYEATESEVKSFLGEPERSGAAEQSDIFFMFGTDAALYNVLVYVYGSNRVTFIFYDGTMMAASIVNSEVWNISSDE